MNNNPAPVGAVTGAGPGSPLQMELLNVGALREGLSDGLLAPAGGGPWVRSLALQNRTQIKVKPKP